jgi:hypothetical protein
MRSWRLLPVLIAAMLCILIACGGEEAASEGADGEAEDQTAEETVTDVVEETEEIEETEVIEPEMTEEEMIAWVMENCICPECPSWIPEAAEKGEGGYCAVGMSECIVEEAGCVCPGCPVTLEKGLEWGYYCTRGSAAEMMEQQEEITE